MIEFTFLVFRLGTTAIHKHSIFTKMMNCLGDRFQLSPIRQPSPASPVGTVSPEESQSHTLLARVETHGRQAGKPGLVPDLGSLGRVFYFSNIPGGLAEVSVGTPCTLTFSVKCCFFPSPCMVVELGTFHNKPAIMLTSLLLEKDG